MLKAVRSFYIYIYIYIYKYRRTGVCVRNDVSEWFPINVRLRPGCVMSPWLFNVYMDGKGLELLSANGPGFEINQLSFEDDTGCVVDSKEKLCRW